MEVTQDNLSLTKKYPCSPSDLFSWYSILDKRKLWCVPKGDEIRFIQNNFTQGGVDIAKCGSPNDLRFTTKSTYHLIVQGELIVFSETVETEDQILACSLNTMHFLENDGGTELNVSLMINSYVGKDMIVGYKNGWSAVLANLQEKLP